MDQKVGASGIKKACFAALALFLTVTFSRNAYPVEPVSAQKEVTDYLTHFYLRPEPAQASEILEKVLGDDYYKSQEALRENVQPLLAYSFGKIARLHPEVKENFKALFEKTDHAGRALIIGIFNFCADESDRGYFMEKAKSEAYAAEKDVINQVFGQGLPPVIDLTTREVAGGVQLDFYWNDFFITGDTVLLKKILNVISRPDKSREKLAAYFAKEQPPVTERIVMDILKSSFEIFINDKKEIVTNDDLDIKLAFGLMMMDQGKEFQRLNQTIVFTNSEVSYLAAKGAAAWALGSNAVEHEKILKFLEAEAQTLSGSPLIRTLLIIGFAEFKKEELDSALKHIDQCLALDSQNVQAHHIRMVIMKKKGDAEEVKKEMAVLEELVPELTAELRRNEKS